MARGLLALVLPLLLLRNLTNCQFIVYNGKQQLVFGATGLRVALEDTSVTTITIKGQMNLTSTTWSTSPPPPVIENRTLLLVGDPHNNISNTINFGGLAGALIVGQGAEVEFRNLTFSNPGPQNISNKTENNINYRPEGFGLWPSVIALNGSKLLFNQSTLQYYSQITWSRCQFFSQKVEFELQNLGYQDALSTPTPSSISLNKLFNLTSDIIDVNTGQIVGQTILQSENTTMTCVADPFLEDGRLSGEDIRKKGGDGFKWWYALCIALGAVILIATVAGITAALVLRQRRRWRRESPPDAEQEIKDSAPSICGGSASLSEENKRSLRPSSSIGAAQPLSDIVGIPPNTSQVSVEGSGMMMASESGRTDRSSRSDQGPSPIPSGGLASSTGLASRGASGGAPNSPVPWSDVTALLRARSDFSDIEVGPLIGRGSFGRVYKGRWKGAFVAIKIVDHQEAASKVIAMREGALSHSVQHPNVITTYSVFLQRTPSSGTDEGDWESDKTPPDDATEGVPERADPSFTEDREQFATCMVLEYADRGTLEKAVMGGKFVNRSDGEPDVRAIHRTLLDIAGGMDYLHSVGVLHGDLKGANVLLKSTATDTRGFTCKLADFGMARLLDTNRTHVSTQTYGTISYMPAELLKAGKLTRAVDSYSFAILMWELFSGEILHTGLTLAQVFYKICYEEHKPPIPEHMPQYYVELMVRCWDLDPSKRPSFSEIFSYLQGLPTLKSGARDSQSTAGSPSRKGSTSPKASSVAITSPFSVTTMTTSSQQTDLLVTSSQKSGGSAERPPLALKVGGGHATPASSENGAASVPS